MATINPSTVVPSEVNRPARKRRSRWADDDENSTADTPSTIQPSSYTTSVPANTRRSRWTVIDHDKDNDLASDLVKLIQQQLTSTVPTQVLIPDSLKLSDDEHRRIVLLHAQVEELARRIDNPQLYIDAIPQRERSPSPPPVYNSSGIRVNKRDQRYKEKATTLRNQKIEQIRKVIPSYTVAGYKKERPFFKVPIPVDEYPTYNFSGLIIGPRGATHRRLENETRCKISVRGRLPNDTKAKKNEYSDQPAHVYIEGELQEDVDRAVELVRSLLTVIDDEVNEHKARQLQELALYNGFVRESDVRRQQQQQRQQKLNEAGIVTVVCSHCGSTSHVTEDCNRKFDTNVTVELSNVEHELKGGYGVSTAPLYSSSSSTSSSIPGPGGSSSGSSSSSTTLDLTHMGSMAAQADLAGGLGSTTSSSSSSSSTYEVVDLTHIGASLATAHGSTAGYQSNANTAVDSSMYAGVDPETLSYITNYYQTWGLLPPGYSYDYTTQRYVYDPALVTGATIKTATTAPSGGTTPGMTSTSTPSLSSPATTTTGAATTPSFGSNTSPQPPPPPPPPIASLSTPLGHPSHGGGGHGGPSSGSGSMSASSSSSSSFLRDVPPPPPIDLNDPHTSKSSTHTDPSGGAAAASSSLAAGGTATAISPSSKHTHMTDDNMDEFKPPAPPGTSPVQSTRQIPEGVPAPPGIDSVTGQPLTAAQLAGSTAGDPPPPAPMPSAYHQHHDPYAYYYGQQTAAYSYYGYPTAAAGGAYGYPPPPTAMAAPPPPPPGGATGDRSSATMATPPPPPATTGSSSTTTTTVSSVSNPQLAAYLSQINNSK